MRTILITGAAGALGTAVTARFLHAGDRVHATDASSTALATLRAVTGADAAALHLHPVDLTDEAQVDALLPAVRAPGERLDALVHLVGGVRPWAATAETATADWDALMTLNLRCAFLVTRAAMRVFRAQNAGSIVTIAAMTAVRPEARKAAYAASKAGVIALTRVLAEEGRACGVNANTIAPSILRTPANLSWAQGSEADAWVRPEDLAETIHFLTTPAARHINGSVIEARGGL